MIIVNWTFAPEWPTAAEVYWLSEYDRGKVLDGLNPRRKRYGG